MFETLYKIYYVLAASAASFSQNEITFSLRRVWREEMINSTNSKNGHHFQLWKIQLVNYVQGPRRAYPLLNLS